MLRDSVSQVNWCKVETPGWHSRCKRPTYFYTSRRCGRRVVKEYGASGEGAEICVQLSKYDRLDREFEASKQRAEVEELRQRIVAVQDWFATVNGVIATALELSGWHRVQRQWRKKPVSVERGFTCCY